MNRASFLKTAARIAAMLTLLSSLTAAAAADALDALKGQSVRALITAPANSNLDRYSRSFIDGLKKFLPETSIYAQNLQAAGGEMAIGEAFAATPDSTITIVFLHSQPLYNALRKTELSTFDLTKFQWVGALTTNQRIMIARKGIGNTLDALRAVGELKTVTGQVGFGSYVETMVVNATTGLKTKVSSGVRDQVPLLLAGDVDFVVLSYAEVKPLIDSGDVVPILRFGPSGYDAEADKLPTLAQSFLPGTPAELNEIIETMHLTGRLIAAAPATRPEFVAALRAAFDQAVADPALQEAFAANGFTLAPTKGEEVAERVRNLLGDPEMSKLLNHYVACGEAISEGTATSCGAM
jgi:tripartite-type tricarboxylate transporter receptor subunit TctC